MQLGLVKEVVAPDDLVGPAVEYAEDLARNCSPASMAVIKRQLYGDANDAVVDVSARAETPHARIHGAADLVRHHLPSRNGPGLPALERRLLQSRPTPQSVCSHLAVDVDNHYYEPIDAPGHPERTPASKSSAAVCRWSRMVSDLAVMGGTVNHFIPNPTFDPGSSSRVA